jgi:mono/diheme cytochrome c family protein
MNADETKPQAGGSGKGPPIGFGRRSTPAWLLLLFAATFYGCLIYFDTNSGGFNAFVYNEWEKTPPKAGELSPEEKLYLRGKEVFSVNCAVCHQATGLGTPGQFPPLVNSDWLFGAGPNRIIRIVLNGAQGPIKVLGQDFNNAMLPFRDMLTKDEDIAAVLTYVRRNKDWGHKPDAPMVTPAQVKTIRDATATRTTAWSSDELLKIPEE